MEAAASILIDVFTVFVAAKLAGAVSTQLDQPPVIGELVAGILTGPYVLGLVGTVHPAIIEGFHGDLENAQQALNLVLGVFAELGAVILLFFVGLETRLSDLMNVGWRAAMVGLFGTVAPFAGGFAVMALQGTNTASALFVAAALVATSIGITARVLEDLGVLPSAEARLILGAAVVDDIVAMIMLGMVNDLATLGMVDLTDIALATSVAAGFTVIVIFVGIWAVSRYHAHLRMLPLPHPMLNIAIALTLGFAVVANLIGLAAIIGAFFAALIFAEQAERYRLTNAIAPIYQFLVPFFFVVIGTQLNPALIVNGGIFDDIIITSIAIVAKLVSAGIGAAGLGLRSVAIIGTGMVPRGEVGLIVASLGLTEGIISPELCSVVVIMGIVTTLIVPPVLTWLIRLKEHRPAPASERTSTPVRPPER